MSENIQRIKDIIRTKNATPQGNQLSVDRVSRIKDILRGNKASEYKLKLAGQGLAEGILETADLPSAFLNQITNVGQLMGEKFAEKTGHPPLHRGESSEIPYISPAIKEYLKGHYGLDLESEQPQTLTGKAIRGGAKFVGGALIPASIGARGATSASVIAKQIGKQAGTAFGAGAGSQVAQAAGVNPLAADIGASILAGKAADRLGMPKSTTQKLSRKEKDVASYLQDITGGPEKGIETAANVRRNIPDIEGYTPTLAELAENPNLAQLQRTQQGVIKTGLAETYGKGNEALRKAFTKAEPTSRSIEDTQRYVGEELAARERAIEGARKGLEPHATPTQAGSAVQKSLAERVERREKARELDTAHLYKQLENIQDELQPTNAREWIKEKFKNAKGDIRTDLEWASNQLKPNRKASKEIIEEYNKAVNIAGNNPARIAKLRQIYQVPETTVAELSATRKALNAKIEKYLNAGENTRAKNLLSIREALDKDMLSYPLEAKTRNAYKKRSEPISEITEHPTLGKVVKKDIYDKEFKIGESSVPEMFIKASEGAVDNAKALMKQLRNDKPALKQLQAYINEKAVNFVTDPRTGKVDLSKIDKFKRQYPSANVLHPHLFETKLKNLHNAQMMANDHYEKTQALADTFYQNAFNKFVPGETKNVGKNIFKGDSKKNAKFLVKEVSKDKTGAALEGLRRYTIDHFIKSIQNYGAEGKSRTFSYKKSADFLYSHKKALQEILTPEQMTLMNKFEKVMEGRNRAATEGSAFGSPTKSYDRNTLDLAEGLEGGLILGTASITGVPKPAVKKVMSVLKGIAPKWMVPKTREQILNQAFNNPEYGAILLEHPLKNAKNSQRFIDFFDKHSYLGIPIAETVIKEERSK